MNAKKLTQKQKDARNLAVVARIYAGESLEQVAAAMGMSKILANWCFAQVTGTGVPQNSINAKAA